MSLHRAVNPKDRRADFSTSAPAQVRWVPVTTAQRFSADEEHQNPADEPVATDVLEEKLHD